MIVLQEPPILQDTKQHLEAMDGDAFERLVVRCLGEMSPELRGLAVLGQNDDGKPIPCPVDGLYFVAAPEPCWVMVASTTMARQKLRGKWLGNAGKAGDVDKAVTWFNEAKVKSPGVKGRLILATNRSLSGNDKLYLDAVSEGRNSGLQMQIIEGSALVRFLDNTREGQSVRQEILGIPAFLISLPLLRQVAQESLKAHWLRYGPGLEEADHLISRKAQAGIRRSLAAGSPLIGLQGASGFGKSVLAHQVARERTEAGDVVIWIPAELITPDAPLATTLSAVLKMFSASLDASAGEDALRLVAEQASRLILLVDDINRTDRPIQLVKTMNGWVGADSYRQAAGSEARRVNSAPPQVSFLVPLWPNASAPSYAGTGADKAMWMLWRLVPVEPYSQKERIMLEEQRQAEHIPDFEGITDALNGDPFLCGLVSPHLRFTAEDSHAELIRLIFEDFLAQSAQAAEERARSCNMLVLTYEVIQAVDALVDLMLDQDEPDLNWTRVQSRLSERQANILRHVADTNQLGWLVSDPQQAVWHWKHTRLRDALIGRRLAVALFPEIATEGDPVNLSEQVIRLLDNPGLCEAWAISLAYLPSASTQCGAIKILGQHAPLALAHALRLSLFPQEAAPREALRMGLKTALAVQPDRSNEFVPSLQTLILEQLSLTDDDLVLDIVEGLPVAWDTEFARLRNGNLTVALGMIADAQRHSFPPAANDRQLEASLQAFGKREARQKAHLIERIKAALQDSAQMKAAVLLMGYLAWPEFSALISISWQQHRSLFFPIAGNFNHGPWLCYLWALGRCCTRETKSTLVELLLGVGRLDDEHREHGATQRYLHFGSGMRQALRFPLSPSAVQTWVEVATGTPTISRDLFFNCRQQEEPDIVEAYVRWAAIAKPFMPGDFVRSSDVLLDPQPIPPGWIHDAKVYQNNDVLKRLWELVTRETNQEVRDLAFTMWKRSASHEEIGLLRSIREDDALFDPSLEVRIRLVDETAAPALAARIRQNPAEWCGYAPRLYHDAEVREAFLAGYPVALEKAHWDVEAAPRHLPLNAIPEFVSRLRPSLLRASETWVPLLLTGVPEALSLVHEAVGQASQEDLQFLFSFSLSSGEPLTKKMLDAIEPALNRCEPNQLNYLVEKAIEDGQGDWVLEHLPEIVTGDGHAPLWLTEADIWASLGKLANLAPQGLMAVYCTSEFHRVVDDRGRRPFLADPMIILRAWMRENPSADQISVAALIISEKGIPDDLLWWSRLQPDDVGRPHWENARRLLKIRRWKN